MSFCSVKNMSRWYLADEPITAASGGECEIAKCSTYQQRSKIKIHTSALYWYIAKFKCDSTPGVRSGKKKRHQRSLWQRVILKSNSSADLSTKFKIKIHTSALYWYIAKFKCDSKVERKRYTSAPCGKGWYQKATLAIQHYTPGN